MAVAAPRVQRWLLGTKILSQQRIRKYREVEKVW